MVEVTMCVGRVRLLGVMVVVVLGLMTMTATASVTECPNEALRIGASAVSLMVGGYELLTPLGSMPGWREVRVGRASH
jgi:hypothetical protein